MPKEFENNVLQQAYEMFVADLSLITDDFSQFWEQFKGLLSSDYRCKKCSKPLLDNNGKHYVKCFKELTYSNSFGQYQFPMMFADDVKIDLQK